MQVIAEPTKSSQSILASNYLGFSFRPCTKFIEQFLHYHIANEEAHFQLGRAFSIHCLNLHVN